MAKYMRASLLVLIGILTPFLMASGSGLVSIWPSIVALVLVFSFRNVLMGLLGGAVTGSFLISEGNLLAVPLDLVEHHLLPNFTSPWKSGAIIFTLLLGGLVQLLEKGGTLQRLLARMLHGQSARKLESGAGLFGIICFFDGLANSLMVGRIFQPMADSAGVPRVRLAYIVDTTSAAVACLAFISTWIAFQLSMIREGFLLAGQEDLAQPYHLFFQSLPHNYYAWFALILMGFSIWKQWDFGPMRQFRSETAPSPDPVGQVISQENGIWRAWMPLALLLIIVFTGIYTDGTERMQTSLFPIEWQKLALSFAEANVPAILVAASALASLLAWALYPRRPNQPEASVGAVYMEGMLHMFQPVLILVMAWMLSSTLTELDAADFLGKMLGGRLDPTIFPLMVFITGSIVAFSTGTSWGTMGLLMPLAIPIAFSITGSDPQLAMQLVPVVIGAVFSGAVFGDHCSPISDTTIVSSIACDIDPMDHVRTQLPYAGLAALGACLFGFPIAGLFSGGSVLLSIVSMVLFCGFLSLLWLFFGRSSSKA